VAFIFCTNCESVREKKREQQSAIVLVLPGVYTGVSVYGVCRRRCARRCNRYAAGPVDIVAPLATQETVGMLSEASSICAYGVCPNSAIKVLPWMMAASSRLLLVIDPVGL
jgi:hypothetical protein